MVGITNFVLYGRETMPIEIAFLNLLGLVGFFFLEQIPNIAHVMERKKLNDGI